MRNKVLSILSILFILFIFFYPTKDLKSQEVKSQEVNYYKDIAVIVKTHCAPCHNQEGLAPFSLLSYEDVASRSNFIGYVTKTRYMPPFKADIAFQHYKNENTLSADEIQLIQTWINTGSAKGQKKQRKGDPIPTDIHQANAPESINVNDYDISVGMQKAFKINELGKEEFRFFYAPLNNLATKMIKSIQFVPGNKKLVHHSRIMTDTTGSIAGIDGISESDTGVYKFQTKPLADNFLFGWVPGNDKIVFPEGTGKKLFQGSNFIFNVHYSPSPIVSGDSSSIRIKFTDKPVEREVITLTLKEDNIANLPFIIKANQVATFYMRSAVLTQDISLISIMPHMHLLGRKFKAFAATPSGDVVQLINIPDWDFNWQMTYTFQNYLYLPKGSVIYAEALYDNTLNNERNPNKQPKDVGYGWGTNDEMMNLVIYYVTYKPGDENKPL